MPRLHSERSRPYPGRPVRYAIQLPLENAMHGNMPGSLTGVSRGHSSPPPADEGPNPEKGKDPSCSTSAMNPPPGEQLVGALTVNPIPMNTCWSGFSPEPI